MMFPFGIFVSLLKIDCAMFWLIMCLFLICYYLSIWPNSDKFKIREVLCCFNMWTSFIYYHTKGSHSAGSDNIFKAMIMRIPNNHKFTY